MDEIKQPTVFMMVGLPGSGKSYFADILSKHFCAKVISSDSIREELYGDAKIQKNHKRVFNLVYQRIREELDKEHNVIYDATNLTIKDRKYFFDQIKNANVMAIVVNTPLEICIKQNLLRDRVVPVGAIVNYSKRFVYPQKSEGFYRVGEIYEEK